MCESDLAVHDYIVARAERNRALMGDGVKCRYGEFAELVDTESTDVDEVGSPVRSRYAVCALPEVFDPVVSIVEVKDKRIIPTTGAVQHHLGITPHVIISSAADQLVISPMSVAGHDVSVADENVVEHPGSWRRQIIATNEGIIAALGVTGHRQSVAIG